jgi:hypothetical protein
MEVIIEPSNENVEPISAGGIVHLCGCNCGC